MLDTIRTEISTFILAYQIAKERQDEESRFGLVNRSKDGLLDPDREHKSTDLIAEGEHNDRGGWCEPSTAEEIREIAPDFE